MNEIAKLFPENLFQFDKSVRPNHAPPPPPPNPFVPNATFLYPQVIEKGSIAEKWVNFNFYCNFYFYFYSNLAKWLSVRLRTK